MRNLRLAGINLPVTLDGLQKQSQTIACEALAIHRPNIALVGKLVDLFDDVSGFVKSKISGLTGVEKIEVAKIIKIMESTNYLDAVAIDIPTPKGLSVNFMEFCDLMIEAQKITSAIYDDTLYPFSVYIGTILNDPEKLSNITFTHNVKLHDIQSISRKFSKAFNGTHTERPYGKCFTRNSDWRILHSKVNGLLDTHNKVPQELIVRTVNELDDSIRTLLERMKDTNEKFRPNSTAMSNMSQLCYAMAEEIMFYSLFTSYLSAFVESISGAEKVLTKRFG